MTRRADKLRALRARTAAALAIAALAAAVAGFALIGRGEDTHTVQARVTLPSAPTAGASLEITGGEGRLRVSDFASLSTSQSYELWNLGEEDPRPAGLFRAAENGSATLTIDQPVKAGDRVLVAIEPGGGSQQPTSKPIASATVPA